MLFSSFLFILVDKNIFFYLSFCPFVYNNNHGNNPMFCFFVFFFAIFNEIKSWLNATISGVAHVAIKHFPCTSICLQAAQTSALSDRQVEQRRILELENTVKNVSNDYFTLSHQLGAHQRFDRSVFTSVLSRPRSCSWSASGRTCALRCAC